MLAASAAMGLALLAGTAQASSTVVWSFDTAPDVTSAWFSWYGGGTVTADMTTGNPGGSMHIFGNSAVDQNMFVIPGWWPNNTPDTSAHQWYSNNPKDLTTYTNVEFDIKWDTANSTAGISDINANGDPFAGVDLWYVDTGNNAGLRIGVFQVPNAASNGWVHVNVPIPITIGASSATSGGIAFKKYAGSAAFGTVAFWIDNIQLDKADVPTPPPTMSGPVPAKTGLNLTAVTGPYNRENIQTIATTNETWIGKGAAGATYSFTIAQGVDGSAGAQFQNHIFLCSAPGTESSPDWNEPNVIFMDLQSTTSGGTSWTFRYKTNLPSGNNMCYNNGSLTVTLTNGGSGYASAPDVSFSGGSGFNVGLAATAQIDDTGVVTNIVMTNNWGFTSAPTISFSGGGGSGAGASVALSSAVGVGIGAMATLTETNPIYRNGTYILSIKNDNQVTMTSPSGSSTNFTVDLTSMQMIGAAPVTAYFGCQAGNAAAVGQLSLLSNVTISGTDNPINDTFANGSILNTNIWLKNSVDANGVLVVPGNVPYDWIYWSVPATGYQLQSGSSLTNMTDVAGNFQAQFGAKIGALAPAIGGQRFFRAIKRVPYQLQVLLPGETNAPGTLTGKIGSPTAQSASVNFGIVPVTVIMCDSAWYPLSSTDTIHITTTDGSATTPLDAALVNGTLTTTTFSFGSAGTFNVTATDVTNGAMLPNTSSSVLVNP